MEITAEITKEEYEKVIRDYYINKDWAKYISVLALVALALALFSVIYYGWRVLYGSFNAYFFLLFLVLFLLPYGFYYFQMRSTVKWVGGHTEQWFFSINETGVYANNAGMVKSYQWFQISKVRKLGEYIVIKPNPGNLLCIPIKFLPKQDADAFLAITNHHRLVPVNRAS